MVVAVTHITETPEGFIIRRHPEMRLLEEHAKPSKVNPKVIVVPATDGQKVLPGEIRYGVKTEGTLTKLIETNLPRIEAAEGNCPVCKEAQKALARQMTNGGASGPAGAGANGADTTPPRPAPPEPAKPLETLLVNQFGQQRVPRANGMLEVAASVLREMSGMEVRPTLADIINRRPKLDDLL